MKKVLFLDKKGTKKTRVYAVFQHRREKGVKTGTIRIEKRNFYEHK